ncbi:EF-hand domain-containing protein [Sinorhizobium sp. BG8]|uniref:EF-hand domain-containing protein n=1 Tax=Sinorhizobium sp. BG8 TaxID=2613773 RepID=UPI00193E9D5C|nr:EF-hand domain-containing protein [Sinorhizobium sp. BG8]QRM54122.1 EF-hand domain-containing protein [Sinorhizobium sp. BG8]
MKKAILISAVLLCQCSLAFAQSQAAMYQGHKDKLDANSNGTVTRSEYQAFMATAFTNLDKNSNGSLSPAEVGTLLTTAQFSSTDANGDGKLEQTEFMNRVMADFKAADKSGDGSLQ